MRDMPPPPPLLRVESAFSSYGPRRVLQGLTLSLQAGEILVLLGPNGAGKSTLVKAMSGRLKLDGGSILVAGLDPATNAEASRVCGIVPQQIALFEKLTAAENLETFGRLMGVTTPDIGKLAAVTLEKVGLGARAKDRVAALSGGMRRRINIAVALMHGPQILVLDEPTVGLDHDARQGLSQMLRALRSDGLGILLTTHDLDEAEALADRVAIMIGGVVKVEGPPRELIASQFQGRRQLTLSLNPAVLHRHPDVVQALTAAGLNRRGSTLTWTGLVLGSAATVEELVGTALSAAGIVEEVYVRQPDLTTLLASFVSPSASGRAR
jgi:ABC-2 type transport system ATP-binding protein